MAKDEDAGDGSTFSDEEWESFAKSFDAQSTKTATYKEPSARQRELTAKWKKEPPKDTGWRGDGPRLDLSAKAGAVRMAYEPSSEKQRAAARRKALRRKLAWVLLAAVVTTGAIFGPALLKGRKFAGSTKVNGATSYVTPGAGQPSGSAASSTPAVGGDVFAGSPAEGYAAGADAIILPPATPVGGYSATQVADALAQAKKLLVAANLEPQVLAGANPDAVLGMLDPLEKVSASLIDSLKHPSEKSDPMNLVTRFSPADSKLATPTIKVHGSMAPSLDENGALIVKADYLFVYGVEAANGSGTPVREVVRRLLTISIRDPRHFDMTAGKIWISEYTDQIDNSPCKVYDGFLHPWFPDSNQALATAAPTSSADTTITGSTPAPTGIATFDPFDQSKAPTGAGFACTSPTRT